MTSLDWNILAAKFYAFKLEADKYGFYVPETNAMIDSLYAIRPYASNNTLDKKTLELSEDAPVQLELNFDAAEVPEYNEEDELVKS